MKYLTTLAMAFLSLAVLMSVSGVQPLSAADYRPLIGKWQRTDGGYVIEIRRVAEDGTLEAGYYNPRPINISKAKASLYKSHLKIFIEMKDVGYPGSTYTLLYDPDKDALLGFYYQAVQRQNFDVIFVRKKQ